MIADFTLSVNSITVGIAARVVATDIFACCVSPTPAWRSMRRLVV
jgi:hypothetical protein